MTQISEAASSRYIAIKEENLALRLHYNDFGHGDNVVIMLHGSGPGASGWANFSKNIEPLVASGYRVILLDCPGWSKSDSIVCSDSRSDLNAIALKGAMDATGIKRASIIGNSMGAHSAVAFALRYPERVNKLVLMGGGTGGPSLFVPTPVEGIKLLTRLYREPTLDNLKRMMDVFVYDTSALTEDLFKARLDNMLSRREHLENYVKSIDLQPKPFPDYGNRLDEIKAETLVIWGRDDRFMPLDVGLRALWGIARADFHVFSRCGHWAQWEHADKFNQLVVNFFNRIA